MKKSSPAAVFVAASFGAATALACLQVGPGDTVVPIDLDAVPLPPIRDRRPMLTFTPPKDSNQLPADIFKLHVHVAVEAVKVSMPLLNGSIAEIGGRVTTDPKGDFKDMIRQFEADPAKHTSPEERSDYGAALVFAGRFDDAIAVLVQLERDYPGRYATAANLGTAYELAGDVPRALEWIKTGIARNRNSHDGTEWLHVAILECKLKLAKDPAWLRHHHVLDGCEDKDRLTREVALEYQLNERLYFIKNDDPIMCDLLYEAARTTNNPTKRRYFLEQVGRFGNIRDNEVQELRAAPI